jgi:hypothetical protein
VIDQRLAKEVFAASLPCKCPRLLKEQVDSTVCYSAVTTDPARPQSHSESIAIEKRFTLRPGRLLRRCP